MYTPLKFINQMEGYFTGASEGKYANSLATRLCLEYISKNRGEVYEDFSKIRKYDFSKISKYNDKAISLDKYNDLFAKLGRALGVYLPNTTIEDYVSLLIYYDVYDIWRKNKLSYLVDSTLFDTLSNAKLPSLAPLDCLTKLPANCFYIDYNGRGCDFCDDLEGSFVSVSNTNNRIIIVLLHLVRSKSMNRVLYLTTAFGLELSGGTTVTFSTKVDRSVNEVTCEDGVVRTVNNTKIANFIYNFLIYLHASNKDVKVSERTKSNHDKVIKQIKNQFKEVKEFEVGFSYGRTISEHSTRYKYIGGKEEENTSKRVVSSHYRSAHWHHYWVGSGENKKLVMKWIEGVFVRGNGNSDEAKNVSVHKVK